MYYALLCNQTGRQMATGLNTTSLDDLAADFFDYHSIDMEDDDVKIFESLDTKGKLDVAKEVGFEILSQNTPFEDLDFED